MKFFNNRKGLTLIELITSIAISSILFVLVFGFISNSMSEMVDNNIKINSIDEGFLFKDTITRIIRSGFNDSKSLTGSTNHVLYLKNETGTEGALIGVVNLDTRKLQQDYIFGDNYLGYRKLSSLELTDIDTDNDKIYDIIFQQDKIFRGLRIKDFKVNLYNNNEIIDLYYSIITLENEDAKGSSFNDFKISNENLIEYNLVF